LDEPRTLWSGTNQAHVTDKNIPQLWQLVEAEAPYKLPDRCAPRVARHRPDGSTDGFSVDPHTPKLVHPKRTPTLPDTDWRVKDRPAILSANEQGHDHECRGRQQEAGEGNHEIHCPLDGAAGKP